ncbi:MULTISPECIES: bifunctional nitrate reductase/sulfite reductase flavoprotein subunit alpha [Mycobacteriaceae]|uniref:Bifunctional nitrate reductase/sulfite reductase flavoprotein subunit alpha n=1 Tax=Mycolicibacterium parafortuitum TaxID=39692 RepID=A0ACC6ME66_MYCPF|nr:MULTISPECIES: bifunctional nitrate reductase/sulfite reductase flavoprotein subunit alpha [Mycobacteriaceae]MDZ5084891.1 bifunctional nitrate reductase/sulfite reductase flavoprotein subunit alpha [Mycolicibacterium parafortuitum]GFM18773.1 molybdopterin oxidoreductase [Mycobacterium sp. PO1]GFM25738.1 molybdopterin oxidoreductase [Mycobacterium sp. PO2]
MADQVDSSTLTRTACSYCGVGCGISVETRADPASGAPVIARVSGDRLHPTNFGRLCTKGATHAELMAATEGRLTTALVRSGRDDDVVSTPVDDALAQAGARLRAIVDEHGPDAVALYVSGQMSIEAQYLATKLAKGYLRTMHIESNSRLCMASAGTGFKQSLGSDGPPGSYTDFDSTDLFFVTGSNMADCHPILYLRMVDRLKAGAQLIVVDPRRTTTADKADLFLQIRPGTDLALLNGLLHLLVQSGDIDTEFIAEHTEGWEAMPAFLADYPPHRVAEITGLAEDDIRTAARMIAEAGEWMSCWTMGLNQSTHGTWNTNAICNLHLATGAICRPGSGPMSLTGQPNAMGGREMGYMGPGLPGQRTVLSADDRVFVEQQWDLEPGTIRTDVGPGTVELFRRLGTGEIKAVWIICTNPVASVANRASVIEGLRAAELVITQDAYADTATNRYADIALPATLWAESDAVMVNSDRNLTLLSQSIPPPGDARPDWELICGVAHQLGFGDAFSYKTSEDVFDEIRRFHNPATGYDLRGVSYQRLRETPVQWPAPPGCADRNPLRYLNDGVSQTLHTDADGRSPRLAFATPSRRAVFHARPHMDAAELPDDEFPMVLNTGRLQHQWHTMTKTGKVAKLNKLNSAPSIEIHPDDAAALGIWDGRQVEVSSRRGRAVLPAVVTDRVRPGNTWVPFHWNDEQGDALAVNAVTNDAVDPVSLQPEFKVCAVRLTPVPVESALPVTADAPELTEDEKLYLSGFLTGLDGGLPGVPVLPGAAPVSARVRLWADGLLAGRFSRLPRTADDSAAGLAPTDAPLVLWASQTGNAEEFAGTLGGRLPGARLQAMDDTPLSELAAANRIILVTSTFGDGGPPDNGADFWERLTAPEAPSLAGVQYSVLGIGDRSYDNFCGHAKSLDTRLADLGATRMLDRTECEAYDQQQMTQWADSVVDLVTPSNDAPPRVGTEGASEAVAPAADPESTLFTRAHPIDAPLCRNTRLTPTGAAKDVRQLGFDISAHDVSYAAGDSLGVYATNSDFVIESWLTATGLHGDEAVVVDGAEMPMREAIRRHFDVCKVTTGLVGFVAEHAPLNATLKRLHSDRDELQAWLGRRNGLDLVGEFAVRADPQEWAHVLVRLTPRQYSISSSPLVSPHEVQLTVSVVRYVGADGGPRAGVASSHLAELPDCAPVPVFLQRSPHFRPPQDPQTPMIMVGPGTGIAPFRAFLQERRALGHPGRNWLFFGDQHRAQNFYYRDDLTDMVDDGHLNRLDLAFSRDQAERVYVQHKMLDYGADVWDWLQDGAHFYVCGDATRMAKDVDRALTAIIRDHGGMSDDAARDYKRQLVADKRYVRDVY